MVLLGMVLGAVFALLIKNRIFRRQQEMYIVREGVLCKKSNIISHLKSVPSGDTRLPAPWIQSQFSFFVFFFNASLPSLDEKEKHLTLPFF
uniref:Uncharacterized protein n=1 Tax=Echeneis naucrates TaxID=173247 RepID=A0A665TA44_ECHNA